MFEEARRALILRRPVGISRIVLRTGAEGGSRTHTSVRILRPERSASTIPPLRQILSRCLEELKFGGLDKYPREPIQLVLVGNRGFEPRTSRV